MARSPETPLLRAFDRLAEVLDSKAAARRWYEQYLATLGARAVVDTANQGAIAWVYRRATGSHEVLPLPAVLWTAAQVGPRLLRGIEIHDGRQRFSLLYDEDGRIADRSLDDRFPGRLVDLARVLKNARDGLGRAWPSSRDSGTSSTVPAGSTTPCLCRGAWGSSGGWA